MSETDRGIQIANAIVAKLAELEQDSRRHWNPFIDFSQTGTLAFFVVPKDDNSEKTGTIGPSGACSQQQDYVVYLIGMFKPLDPLPGDAADSAANRVYEMHEALKQVFLTLADGSTAKWQKSMSAGHDFKDASGGLYHKEYALHYRVYT